MATTEADAVAYFLDDLEHHGKSERTLDAYERVLRRFDRFLSEERGVSSPREAGRRDCLAFIHGLRGDSSRSTVATYASYLHRFYAYMNQVGEFEANPMTLVMEELDESIDKDPARRDISIGRMRSFVAGITHPLERAVVVTLLKTGMRVGELCNLDLRDVNLADGSVNDAFGVTPRVQLETRPNTLFVTADVNRGAVVNGEERTASNKRMRDTLIPIDAELHRELKRYLAIRPAAQSAAEPLFVSTKDRCGHRLKPEWARSIVTDHARDAGWYRDGGNAAENVTPHYFRHFFTTHLRDRTGDRGIVKYLRGDVAEDIIDTYTHNWGDRVREVYEANIYAIT
ncbi:MAG: tyrosine-type recombinase/integrase [Halobacteriales archaeon]